MASDGGPAFPMPDTYHANPAYGISFRDALYLRLFERHLAFDEPEDWDDVASLSWRAAQLATDERERRLRDEQAG